MEQYFFKLVAPRLTFAQDMSADEAALMPRHVAYWRDLTEKRIAVIVGPVFDPAGGWGLAVVEVESRAEAHALASHDPVIEANRASAMRSTRWVSDVGRGATPAR